MGENPLAALGVPGVWSVERAVFLHDLLTPRDQGGKTQGELDDGAQAVLDAMDARDSWTQATRTGYRGPRGRVPTKVRQMAHTPVPRRINIQWNRV